MKVNELADLTATTVRTVRHYHHVGLLPVPPVRYGRRDYDLRHVARLIHIRHLAQAGVPLARIAGMLPDDVDGSDGIDGSGTSAGSGGSGRSGSQDEAAPRAAVLVDLRATLVDLDEHLERLTAQRAQVLRLVATVERDHEISPLPPTIRRFYADLEQRAPEAGTAQAIRRERDFMELACYRGDLPPEVEVVYEHLDDARRAESLSAFGQLAARAAGREMSDADRVEVAAGVVRRLRARLGDDLPRLARAVDLALVRRAAELYVRVAPTGERALVREIADALVATIEQERLR